MQLEQWQDVIDAAIQNLKEWRDTNTYYLNQAADHWAEDIQIGNVVLMRNTRWEQSRSGNLNARWQAPYCITGIVQSLGSNSLAELDGA